MEGTTISLKPVERIHLIQSGLIPEQGDFITLKRANELKDKLNFTEQETKDWDIVNDGATIRIGDASHAADVEIGQTMFDKISATLIEKNKGQTLSQNDVSLYEKFVLGSLTVVEPGA